MVGQIFYKSLKLHVHSENIIYMVLSSFDNFTSTTSLKFNINTNL